jgi:hypothetical protein
MNKKNMFFIYIYIYIGGFIHARCKTNRLHSKLRGKAQKIKEISP